MQRGLSLLEALVTVAIFAMLMVVLSSGWQQSLMAQRRLAEAASAAQRHLQLNTLVRSALQETLSAPDEHTVAFFGDGKGIDTESSTALNPNIGAAPAPLQLRLDRDGDGWRLALQGKTSVWPWKFDFAELHYVDAAGQVHPQWPPDGIAVARYESDQHLPRLIRFDYRFEGERRTRSLLVAPLSASWNFPEPRPPFQLGAD